MKNIFTFKSIQKEKYKTKRLGSGVLVYVTPKKGNYVTGTSKVLMKEIEEVVQKNTSFKIKPIDTIVFSKEQRRKNVPFQCYELI